MTNHNSTLHVNNIGLSIYLGWPENERLKRQNILLDLKIVFPNTPTACDSDKLEDTVCYAGLIQDIHAMIGDKHFHLIEHLAATLHTFIKAKLPAQSRLLVSVTKHPKIHGFEGHVKFCFGDE